MLSYEADNHAKSLCNLLESKPDYKEFIHSQEYRAVVMNDPDKSDFILRNKEFILHGDIRSIQISSFGNVSMALTIDNKFNGITSTTEVRIDVPENLRYEIIKLRPDTGVTLRAKYLKLNVVVDTFELISIEEKELPLYFPYCVCMGDNPNPGSYSDICHRIFGYAESDYSDRCPLCGSTTKKFTNVYTEDFQNLIKLSRRGI